MTRLGIALTLLLIAGCGRAPAPRPEPLKDAKGRQVRAVVNPLMSTTARLDTMVTSASVVLRWTAPGDDGYVGIASKYDLRFSTTPITENNFWQATPWTVDVPLPEVAGTVQGCVVSGLQLATTYYFAIRAIDENGNASQVCNPLAITTAPLPDTINPGGVCDLTQAP